jgi:lysozyme
VTYDRAALKTRLRLEEGEVLHAYQDSLGWWTIGVGHLIDGRKGGSIPPEISDALLEWDLNRIEGLLDRAIPWWRDFGDARQQVVMDLAFNMGWAPNAVGGFDDFHDTLAALRSGRFVDAAMGLRKSLWYRQVGPRRAEPLCAALENGSFSLTGE